MMKNKHNCEGCANWSEMYTTWSERYAKKSEVYAKESEKYALECQCKKKQGDLKDR